MRNEHDSRGKAMAAPRHTKGQSSVAVGFVTGMLAGPAAHGIDLSAALARAGIDDNTLSDPAGRIPLRSYAVLYNALVHQFEDEGFMLFSAPLRPGTFEFLCRSMLFSQNLAEALDRGLRFMRLVLPDLEVTVVRNKDVAEICIAETRPLCPARDDPRRVFAYEWLLRLLHGLACWLAGRELALGSVRFPYPRPDHFADYALIYTPHSVFDADRLVASLNANLLDLPIRQDDSTLDSFLEGAPGKITMLYRRDRDTVHRVRDLMAKAFPESLALEDAARELNMSSRNLHRRLQDENSSFRAIKNALRRDIALSQIEKTDQPISQIAANLGFSEPSTFFRAFQTWTGLAPTEYRNRLATAGNLPPKTSRKSRRK